MARADEPNPGAELVFALCHEIGNLVGAVRLHAHLLDDEMGPRELAMASVELDDLSARATALLTQVRPLLSEPAPDESVDAASLVGVVAQLLEEFGGRGKTFVAHAEPDLPAAAIGKEVIQPLLTSLLYASLEAVEVGGKVALLAEVCEGEIAFSIEDDAVPDEDPTLWAGQMRRGRPLLCAVADALLRKRGGHLRVSFTEAPRLTRISLILPVASA